MITTEKISRFFQNTIPSIFGVNKFHGHYALRQLVDSQDMHVHRSGATSKFCMKLIIDEGPIGADIHNAPIRFGVHFGVALG